jgi:3-dehydroquinate synthase
MPPVPTISVNLAEAPYDIVVAPGSLTNIGPALRAISRGGRAAVVTDSTVAPLHLAKLTASLKAGGFDVVACIVPAGEDHKTLGTIAAIYDTLLPARLDRKAPLIALGGGVIGDMAGFAAATILRGLPFVQVPTSLLAMVDASVGGKTGVNHAVGKNLIGAFHQPIAVFIDPQVLATLPPRELRAGLAECIKHDIIRDAEGFNRLEQSIHRALALDMDYLTDLVAHNVAIKAKVVAADPLENGERAHLNFGHTFGHAIEIVSRFSYSHGESVALGMTAAAFAAERLDMIDAADRSRIVGVIRRAGLPTGGLDLAAPEIIDAMHFDKKVSAGKIRFVLPDRIGHVVIRDDLDLAIVREAIESLRS